MIIGLQGVVQAQSVDFLVSNDNKEHNLKPKFKVMQTIFNDQVITQEELEKQEKQSKTKFKTVAQQLYWRYNKPEEIRFVKISNDKILKEQSEAYIVNCNQKSLAYGIAKSKFYSSVTLNQVDGILENNATNTTQEITDHQNLETLDTREPYQSKKSLVENIEKIFMSTVVDGL